VGPAKVGPIKVGPYFTRTQQRWIQLPAGYTAARYCCQQATTTVSYPSLLGLALPPDPIMVGLGD